jgi:hypothetical protein
MAKWIAPLVVALTIVLTHTSAGTAQTGAVDPHAVVMMNADEAPADLTNVELVRSSLGIPEVVHVTVRNRGEAPLALIRINAFVFNEKGILRLRAFNGGVPMGRGQLPTFGQGALAPHDMRSGDIMVHHVDARPDWKVVVAIEEADTATTKWTNDNLREKAQVSVQGLP